MTTEKEYEPFGDEWLAEMKKFNKTQLIDYLRNTLIAQKEKVNVYDSLLRELRETYLYNVDDEGEPKASIKDMINLWHRTNKILNL